VLPSPFSKASAGLDLPRTGIRPPRLSFPVRDPPPADRYLLRHSTSPYQSGLWPLDSELQGSAQFSPFSHFLSAHHQQPPHNCSDGIPPAPPPYLHEPNAPSALAELHHYPFPEEEMAHRMAWAERGQFKSTYAAIVRAAVPLSTAECSESEGLENFKHIPQSGYGNGSTSRNTTALFRSIPASLLQTRTAPPKSG